MIGVAAFHIYGNMEDDTSRYATLRGSELEDIDEPTIRDRDALRNAVGDRPGEYLIIAMQAGRREDGMPTMPDYIYRLTVVAPSVEVSAGT